MSQLDRVSYTIDELSEISGLSRSGLYKAVQRGHLRVTRPTGTSRLLVLVEDWDRFLNGDGGTGRLADVIPLRPR